MSIALWLNKNPFPAPLVIPRMLVPMSSTIRDLLAVPGELHTALAALVNPWLLLGSVAGPLVLCGALRCEEDKERH